MMTIKSVIRPSPLISHESRKESHKVRNISQKSHKSRTTVLALFFLQSLFNQKNCKGNVWCISYWLDGGDGCQGVPLHSMPGNYPYNILLPLELSKNVFFRFSFLPHLYCLNHPDRDPITNSWIIISSLSFRFQFFYSYFFVNKPNLKSSIKPLFPSNVNRKWLIGW